MSLKFDVSSFRTDPDLVASGVWIDFGAGARMKIAGFENEAFTQEVRRLAKPYTDLGKEPTEAEQEDIMCRAMAHHILLDWENVFEKDKPLPYSTENAYRLLKELPRIRTRVLEEARKIDNFRAREREEIEGNSESASSGT